MIKSTCDCSSLLRALVFAKGIQSSKSEKRIGWYSARRMKGRYAREPERRGFNAESNGRDTFIIIMAFYKSDIVTDVEP